jgi:hypothetical protein
VGRVRNASGGPFARRCGQGSQNMATWRTRGHRNGPGRGTARASPSVWRIWSLRWVSIWGAVSRPQRGTASGSRARNRVSSAARAVGSSRECGICPPGNWRVELSNDPASAAARGAVAQAVGPTSGGPKAHTSRWPRTTASCGG